MSSSSLNQHGDLALVRTFVDSFCAAFNRKDAAALGPLFSADIDFVTIFGVRAVGREAVLKMHDQLFTTGLLVGSEVSMGEADCNRIAPNIVVGHVSWNRTAGKQMPAGSGLFTVVLRDTAAGKAEVVALTNVENRKPGPMPGAEAAPAAAAAAAAAPAPAADCVLHVQKLVAEVPVVLFSASTCKYSAAAKRLLLQYPPLTAPAFQVVEVDVAGGSTIASEAQYRDAFKQITGATSTPRFFVKGKCLGGADDMQKLHEKGELAPLLQGAVAKLASDKYDQQALLTVCTKKPYAAVCDSVQSMAARFKYGMLHRYDLMQLLQSKGQSDMKTPVSVFEVCNPAQAFKVLRQHPQVSNALPCRVSIWRDESADQTVIQTIKPSSIIGMFHTDDLKEVAAQVEGELYTIMMQIM